MKRFIPHETPKRATALYCLHLLWVVTVEQQIPGSFECNLVFHALEPSKFTVIDSWNFIEHMRTKIFVPYAQNQREGLSWQLINNGRHNPINPEFTETVWCHTYINRFMYVVCECIYMEITVNNNALKMFYICSWLKLVDDIMN